MRKFKSKVTAVVVTLSILVGLISATASANIRTKKIGITSEQAAIFLQDKSLLQGDDKGNLMLDKELTREQMMVIMSRLLGVEKQAEQFPTDKMTFKDVKSDFYAHFVAWAQANKITEGLSPEEFGFGQKLTVWQTNAFFVRVLGYTNIEDSKLKTKAVDFGITDSTQFKDEKFDKDPMKRGDMSILMYNTLYVKTSRGVLLGEQMGLFPKQ